jgi:hypothetical protein
MAANGDYFGDLALDFKGFWQKTTEVVLLQPF